MYAKGDAGKVGGLPEVCSSLACCALDEAVGCFALYMMQTAPLYAALSYAARDLPPTERLIALGLAYVRFAHDNPQHFMLIFARLPSQRTSLQAPSLTTSPYQLVLHTVQEGVDAGVFRVRPGLGVEEIAYGVWVMAHGMAMLQQTHLQQFQADFLAHDRHVLEAFVHGLGRD